MMENYQLLEKIGETKSQKLISDISKEYFEIKNKRFPSSENILNCCSIVTVTDPKKKSPEIESIGMSCINDLLTDNFGKWLNNLLSANAAAFTMNDLTNVARNMVCYSATVAFNMTLAGGIGSLIQIGKGTTLAARSDFNIETAFTNGGAEDNIQNTGLAGWSSVLGQITIPAGISPTNGPGDVSETILVAQWNDNIPVNRQFVLSRDNISPVVSFVSGKNVNVEYIIQL